VSDKEQLIKDIEQLLNSYDGLNSTHIEPSMLEFMDEQTLRQIISSLLDQKNRAVSENLDYLEQFKKY